MGVKSSEHRTTRQTAIEDNINMTHAIDANKPWKWMNEIALSGTSRGAADRATAWARGRVLSATKGRLLLEVVDMGLERAVPGVL